MDFFNSGYKPTNNEISKAGRLLTKAVHMGMDVTGYGMLDYNQNSGNVYLWLEDYNFCLFVDIPGTMRVCYSCPYDGEKTIRAVSAGTSLLALENWAEKLAKKSDKKENS